MRGVKPDCYVPVIVDRQIRYHGFKDEALFDVNTIGPPSIAAIGYYTRSQIPSQFNATGAACGTLVIWTRMRIK